MTRCARPSVVAVALIFILAACSTAHTKFPVQRYVPVSRDMEPLGELHLSNTLMRLEALEGEMKLEYVGQMPEAAGESLGGASVYRVRNWRPYFKQNAGRAAYCGEPPRWIAVNSKTGAPAWSQEISVAFLTLEKWESFSPAAHRSCAAGTYVRTAD